MFAASKLLMGNVNVICVGRGLCVGLCEGVVGVFIYKAIGGIVRASW